jgi:UDP-glucose 4-epimerase
LRAFSGYGLSKGLTWQVFRHHCGEAHVPLGKFVIPNPFGPLEELRFTAYLMRSWKEGKPAGVRTPDYVRDNIHVDLLAAAYAKFAAQVPEAKAGTIKINPSGYIETQGEFAQRVAREVQPRLGWECKLELARQDDFSEPLRRVNTGPAAAQFPEWNERAAWDAFVEFYSPRQP